MDRGIDIWRDTGRRIYGITKLKGAIERKIKETEILE